MTKTRKSKKRKFSNNQPVVFRFSDRKMIGKVVFIRPIGKRYLYDVLAEDGKVYQELDVDVAMNQCIDTHLTRLYYQKYSINIESIPEVEDESAVILNSSSIDSAAEAESESTYERDELPLYEDEDLDPNY